METTIKDQVKNIFKTNAFETALELTRDLRGEYINENGVKSWNALVAYYKKANIQVEITHVAEPGATYTDPSTEENNVGDHHNTLSGLFVEEEVKTTPKSVAITPMMKQYEEMKKKHPDAILLFRVGDFYETFSEDAIAASEILGITLTRRSNGKAQSVELTGFPHHALDSYLPKLVRAGRRVAICEQLEDPKKVKIKEVVTPNEQSAVSVNNGVAKEESNPEEHKEEKGEEERVEYMLYQNDGEKVDWYGHFVNYKGLKVGDSAMMVRMNNLGVGRGKVLATASMTMNEIGMFHKCYAFIRQSYVSDNKRVELFTKAFNNLQEAMRDPKFSTLSKGKDIADFVLKYKKEN